MEEKWVQTSEGGNGRIMLNMTAGCAGDSSGSGQGPVAVSREYENEPSCSIEGGVYLDWMSDYWLLMLHGVS
jgi:hypothetical protein